jgi:hypothetical protein
VKARRPRRQAPLRFEPKTTAQDERRLDEWCFRLLLSSAGELKYQHIAGEFLKLNTLTFR